MKKINHINRYTISPWKQYWQTRKKLTIHIAAAFFSSSVLISCGGGGGGNNAEENADIDNNIDEPIVEVTPEPTSDQAIPSRSSSIALTSDDSYLVVANRQKNSVSVIQVRDEDGIDTEHLLAEIPVGSEPRFVAISPDNTTAYVSNSLSGNVSVINLATDVPHRVGDPIAVGTEPRGIAISPNGNYVYVANHTSGDISVISTTSLSVVNTVAVGGNPMALAITNDLDTDDRDEQVYVTRFYSEVIDPINRPDGFNDAKQGVVNYFNIDSSLSPNTNVFEYTLAPITDAGFSADRRQFCQDTRDALQADDEVTFFNSGVDGTGDGAAALANEIFCPDTSSTDSNSDSAIAQTTQGAYTNYLYSAVIRNNRLFISNVGASPEPPVRFNLNVQALISSVDLSNGSDFTINLNNQIKTETQPDVENESLDRLFGNDIVAIEASTEGDQFLVVSRGGNYIMRAGLDANGNININAANEVVRFQTGNIPSGVVMSFDGTRAYSNNEVSTSVTSIDLDNNQVLNRDISSSEPPAPGTQQHRNLLGKLVFYTALGTPDQFDTDGDSVFDINIRDIDPLTYRGKASDNAWSSCASCHEDGHSDNVTWIFPTGPRQTIPLEGTFADSNTDDQRILNWNAVRGSVTDFNNNSRGVQGGTGFATNVDGIDKTGQVFNHGPTKGISDALDAMTEWVANTVDAPIMPEISTAAYTQGRAAFETYCIDCHVGEKWTKSTISGYQNNPTFAANPLAANFFADGREPALDPLLTVAGPQIVSVTQYNNTETQFLENVGTLIAGNPLEIRGAGAIGGGTISIEGDINNGIEVAAQSTQGFASLSAAGAFNVPSLLGTGLSSPYLHDGSAITLDDVFTVHTLPAFESATIKNVITDSVTRDYLSDFVISIDEETPIFSSNNSNDIAF